MWEVDFRAIVADGDREDWMSIPRSEMSMRGPAKDRFSSEEDSDGVQSQVVRMLMLIKDFLDLGVGWLYGAQLFFRKLSVLDVRVTDRIALGGELGQFRVCLVDKASVRRSCEDIGVVVGWTFVKMICLGFDNEVVGLEDVEFLQDGCGEGWMTSAAGLRFGW
ncbi:hypothetical protein Tco_0713726 [Tanacetum coccineum]